MTHSVLVVVHCVLLISVTLGAEPGAKCIDGSECPPNTDCKERICDNGDTVSTCSCLPGFYPGSGGCYRMVDRLETCDGIYKLCRFGSYCYTDTWTCTCKLNYKPTTDKRRCMPHFAAPSMDNPTSFVEYGQLCDEQKKCFDEVNHLRCINSRCACKEGYQFNENRDQQLTYQQATFDCLPITYKATEMDPCQ